MALFDELFPKQTAEQIIQRNAALRAVNAFTERLLEATEQAEEQAAKLRQQGKHRAADEFSVYIDGMDKAMEIADKLYGELTR